MRASMARAFLAATILGLLVSTSASAGPLFNHPNAGVGPLYTGSTPFVAGTLTGYVDYAVFNPGNFPYSGYTPTAGELTYAYQIFVTGTAPLSSFSLGIDNQADNIGSFNNIGAIAPSSQILLPFNAATWTFAGIPGGSSSIGLAFSSTQLPISGQARVIDTGQSGDVIPLPVPGPTSIPEPTTLGLVAMGCVTLVMRRRNK